MPIKVSDVEDLMLVYIPNRPFYSCGLVFWPLSEYEAEVDLVFIQTFFLFQINENFALRKYYLA